MLKQEFFLFLVEYVWVCFVGGLWSNPLVQVAVLS